MYVPHILVTLLSVRSFKYEVFFITDLKICRSSKIALSPTNPSWNFVQMMWIVALNTCGNWNCAILIISRRDHLFKSVQIGHSGLLEASDSRASCVEICMKKTTWRYMNIALEI